MLEEFALRASSNTFALLLRALDLFEALDCHPDKGIIITTTTTMIMIMIMKEKKEMQKEKEKEKKRKENTPSRSCFKD